MESNVYIIDAAGKRLGRVAAEAAHVLLGKSRPDFTRNIASDTRVEIVNASKLLLSEVKREKKMYTRYTGYPSGLRRETAGAVISKKGHAEIVRKAVYGMIPSNRLKRVRMKNLTVKE